MKLAKDCPTHTHMRSVASDSRRGGGEGLPGVAWSICGSLQSVKQCCILTGNQYAKKGGS